MSEKSKDPILEARRERTGESGPDGAKRMSVMDAMGRGVQLYQNGKFVEAENIFRQIIKARPQFSDAYNSLGVVLHSQGKTDEGIKALRKAIRINGASPSYYANLGELERLNGDLDKAMVALKRAVTLDPNSAEALNNLGIVHYDQREYDKAEACYRKAISINDTYVEAFNNLGNALRALDKGDDALQQYERAIELRETYAEAYNNMGTVLRDQQKYEEAEACYRRAAQLKPDYLEPMNNLAGLFVAREHYEDALRVLGDVLKQNPNHVPSLVNVARAQLRRESLVQAEAACKQALRHDPESAEALCVLGQVYHETDRYEEALGEYGKALAIKPDYPECMNYKGIALKSVGRLDEAREIFLAALEINPKALGAYSNLVDLEKFTPDHPLFTAMQNIIAEADDPEADRFTAVHFALGKAHDDIGDHEKAFEHYSTGARLKRATLDYKEEEIFQFFDDIKSTFSADFIQNPPFEGLSSVLPIFIIGMPRSGSTLTEQIISSHPEVYGAGEIKTLSQVLGQVRQKFPNLPRFPQMAAAMKTGQYNAVAQGYLGIVSNMSETASRVTDKLLTNYYFAGLIHTLFPNAKIIHTMRNPVDTCLSAFTKLFKDDMPHSYDLEELGRYYRKYEDVMEHWRTVLPQGVMMDIQYEELVSDVEGRARALIDFCGLEWDERCLAFHESTRPVKTASVSQVRKPLYNTSVERWKRYGDRLNPLVEALEMEKRTENGRMPV